MAFKVLCVDHVGVAVNDLALIKKQMKDLLNLEPSLPDETVEEQHVRQASSNRPHRAKHANWNSWGPQLRTARLPAISLRTVARTVSSM